MKLCKVMAGSVVCGSTQTAIATNDEIDLGPQPNLKWQATPEGVGFAALKGNRFEESYMAMLRLPTGLTGPVLRKSAATHGVVVSGQALHLATRFSPGSET